MRYSRLSFRSLVTFVFTFGCLDNGPTFGKPVLPAGLAISASDEDAGSTITITIVASSHIPVQNAELSVLLTESGAQQSTKTILWTGDLDAASTITQQMHLVDIKPGLRQYTARFSFSPKAEASRPTGLTRHLYLDIRSDRVLTSNVSFKQIRRLELREILSKEGIPSTELQKKVFQTQYPHLAQEIAELNQENPIQDIETLDNVKPQALVPVDAQGEPIRTPAPPKPNAKPTTEKQN